MIELLLDCNRILPILIVVLFHTLRILIRKNRRNLPKLAVDANVRKREIIAKLNFKKGTIRDVLLLSTKHTDKVQDVQQSEDLKKKPCAVADYNHAKGFANLQIKC